MIAYLFFTAVHWYPLTHKDRSSFFSSFIFPKDKAHNKFYQKFLSPSVCNTAIHNIIFLCKTFWQQCRERNNKCSLYCLLSKFWYESLKLRSLLSLKKKVLLKPKDLTEVLLHRGSQTRVYCLLKNVSRCENQIQHWEQHLHGNFSGKSSCWSHCL